MPSSQRVAPILTCPRVHAPSVDQTRALSRPRMRIMQRGSCSLKPAVVLFVAPLCSKELRLVTVQLPEKSWLSDRGSTELWPSSWYSKNVVEDVGFMVNEAPPSTRGAAFLLQWSPRTRKAGSSRWPKER